MSGLREQFLDGLTVPSDLVLRIGDIEFLDIANQVFGFHDAVVLTSHLSLLEARMELVFNYVAKTDIRGGLLHYQWRKLRLYMGRIESITFGYEDPEYGWLGYVNRQINLEQAIEHQPSVVTRVQKELWRDHEGAVLDSINFEKHTAAVEGLTRQHDPTRSGTVQFDWLTVKRTEILVERIHCRDIELQFASAASDQMWQA